MLEWHHDLANLLLLPGVANIEKNGKTLDVFLSEMSDSEQKSFRTAHYFPKKVDTDLASFQEFILAREALLRDKLAMVLGVELQAPVE